MFDEAFAPHGLQAEPLAAERIGMTAAGDLFVRILRARPHRVDEAHQSADAAPGDDLRRGTASQEL
jgi:hypothetical protein